jgi:hypothetical protein
MSTMTQTAVLPKLASRKQIKYVADLAAQRNTTGKIMQPVEVTIKRAILIAKSLEVNPRTDFDSLVTAAGITGRHASVAINALLKIKPTPKTSDDFTSLQELLKNVPDGFYALPRKVDGVWDFFEVRTKAKGARWVNQLLGGNRKMLNLSFQSAAARAIGTDHKAAAVAYATHSKNCPKCGTQLTTPRSLQAKIGPTCAKAWGWSW